MVEGIGEGDYLKAAGNGLLFALGLAPIYGVARASSFTQLEKSIIREANTIYSSKEFGTIEAAFKNQTTASVTINGRIINFNPETPGSSLTMHASPFNEGSGFQLGNHAFSSIDELKKTFIRELYRLKTENTNMIGVDVTKQYTQSAESAADKLYQNVIKN